MARSIRIEFPGAYYHVMARGNRRERIFRDDDDRRFFLKTLSEACGMTGWKVHAWVLMSNHYHLMIETPQANLVAGMKWLQNAYTRRFNTRHQLWGRLFGDRYKAIVTEGEQPEYYCTLMDYIHLNPVRARLVDVRKGESVLDYPWSSVASGYALAARSRAPWLAVSDGLRAYGWKDDVNGRRRFVEHLDRRAIEESRNACGVPPLPEDERLSHLRRGWYWGTQAFAERMLKLVKKTIRSRPNRTYASGPVVRSHDVKEAEELLARGLREHGLDPEELARLPGSDPRKVAIAREIWASTTVSQGWIAEHLAMRSAANVSQQLHRAAGNEKNGRQPSQEMNRRITHNTRSRAAAAGRAIPLTKRLGVTI